MSAHKLRREETKSMSMILLAGATGNVDRHVASQLLNMGIVVWELTRNREYAGLPGEVDVVRGGLSLSGTRDACLDRVESAFQVWPSVSAGNAPAFLDVVTKHARRIVYLSSESVGHAPEQQTDATTARIADKLAA
jgi:nucleoside-diphosphate-sugar epimerase